jgi:uncharacterized protein YjbI with pentapeptide repeats
VPSPAAEPRLPRTPEQATLDDLDHDVHLQDVVIDGGVAVDLAVEDLRLTGCRLSGVRLPGATLDGPEWADVVFEDCDLSGVTLKEVMLRRVVFRRCRLSALVAAELVASDLRLVDCKADEAWFRMARVERAGLSQCDLTGSDWYRAQVSHAHITGCRLAEANFSLAKLDDVALHGSSLAGVLGGDGLRNVVVGPEQVLDLALVVLPSLGIRIEDPPDDGGDGDR